MTGGLRNLRVLEYWLTGFWLIFQQESEAGGEEYFGASGKADSDEAEDWVAAEGESERADVGDVYAGKPLQKP